MKETTHRIRRQRWVIHTTSAAQAFELRHRLRADWAERLQPAFEQAFGEVDRPGVTLRIPKIELRFKLPAGEKMLERLPELIQRQLTEQLQEALRPDRELVRKVEITAVPVPQNQFEHLLAYLRSGLLNWELAGAGARPAEDFQAIGREQWEPLQTHLRHHQESAAFYFRLWQLLGQDPAPPGEAPRPVTADSRFADLLAYLQTGLVSWAVASPGPRPLVEFRETCRQQWVRILDHLRTSPESTPFYFRLWRILEQEEPRTLVSLVTSGLPEFWQDPASCLLHLLLTGSDGILETAVRQQLVAAFGAELLQYHHSNPASTVTVRGPAEEPATPVPYFSALVESGLPVAQQSALVALIELQSPTAARWFHAEARRETQPSGIPAERLSPVADIGAPAAIPAAPEAEPRVKAPKGQVTAAVTAGPQPAGQNQSSARSAATDDTLPLTVFLAGLVLLHPYISQFLAARGLPLVPNQPFTELELARAAALLHHLATGAEEIQEYELNFIKVLLGLSPETPLCVGPGWVRVDDRSEAQVLLASVIEHWTALKNTTPDGLRATFLIRPGLLRQDENGWRLQFERTAFDLLLDRLPWSIRVVKLPWMRQPVYVAW